MLSARASSAVRWMEAEIEDRDREREGMEGCCGMGLKNVRKTHMMWQFDENATQNVLLYSIFF